MSPPLFLAGLVTKHQTIRRHKILKGLAIYQTGASPFWFARVWCPRNKKYRVRSTKETVKVEAIDQAHRIASALGSDLSKPSTPTRLTFGHFAEELIRIQHSQVQRGERSKSFVWDDVKLLSRSDDGILAVFRDQDVRQIQSSDLREYLHLLDQNREKPLSSSSQAKHLGIVRKVLKLALEARVIDQLPLIPSVKTVDRPRPTFTPEEVERLYAACRELAEDGIHKVRGNAITGELQDLVVFLVHSLLRPTVSEVFSLRHRDIQVKKDHLYITVAKGKTGYRDVYTTAVARRCYLDLLERLPARSDEEFVFFPKFKNRAHASRVAANQFNFVLGKSGLKEDRLGQLRTLYSLRHFGIQARLAAQMPIYDLAKNAGTSVEMIERFYGRFPAYSEQRAEIMNTGLVKKN